MPLILEVQAVLPLPVGQTQLQTAIETVLAAAGAADPLPTAHQTLTLRVTDDAEVRQLNLRYRGENQTTDILSFSHVEDCLAAGPDIPDLQQEWGDLILSLPYIERYACQAGTSLAAEFLLCFVHGLLHLLGWDHDTPERTRAMFTLQDRLLRAMGYRPRRTWPPAGTMPDG